MAKLARGAVLRADLGSGFVVINGLGDIDWNPGELSYADTTHHATTQFRTSRTPTHRGEASLTAPLHWDADDSDHAALNTTVDTLAVTPFQLVDPTATTPQRWAFSGYASITFGLPVNGIAQATLTVSAEPPIDYEADV